MAGATTITAEIYNHHSSSLARAWKSDKPPEKSDSPKSQEGRREKERKRFEQRGKKKKGKGRRRRMREVYLPFGALTKSTIQLNEFNTFSLTFYSNLWRYMHTHTHSHPHTYIVLVCSSIVQHTTSGTVRIKKPTTRKIPTKSSGDGKGYTPFFYNLMNCELFTQYNTHVIYNRYLHIKYRDGNLLRRSIVFIW